MKAAIIEGYVWYVAPYWDKWDSSEINILDNMLGLQTGKEGTSSLIYISMLKLAFSGKSAIVKRCPFILFHAHVLFFLNLRE